MTDRIDALERLQKLRESGAINDAEFEREKALIDKRGHLPRLYLWIGVATGAVLIGILTVLVFLPRGRDATEQNEVVANTAPSEPRADQLKPEPVATVRSRPPAEQLATAFEAAFGNRTRAERRVDQANYIYSPGGLQWIGNRAILVSPGRSDQDCHACAGTLAIHYLEPVGEGFAVQGEWLTGGGFDDWGRPPDWRFSSEISGQTMLRTEGGGGNQGIFCTSVTFYDFGPNGPREVADIRTGYSNASGFGEDDGTDIEGRIRNARKDASFEVAYSGTRAFVERWVKRGGRFVLSHGETAMPSC